MKKLQQPDTRPKGDGITRIRTAAVTAGRSTMTVSVKNQGQAAARPRKRRPLNRKQKIQIAALSLAAILLVAGIAGYTIWRQLMNQIIVVDPVKDTIPSEFNLPTESLVNPVPSEKKITNILLLGVDARDRTSVKERSDSMMILTIDQINNKIKLTSLQRDMLAYVPGKENPVKINSANAFGGPLLAMRVVNETFRLDIRNYMVVNMLGMEKIIDLAGGVMIDVSERELPYLNRNLGEENRLYPDTPQAPEVTIAGPQQLSGRQAVGYARIRKLDSDYKRMERQRIVIQALLNAFKSASLLTKGNMISEGLGLITTNLSASQITEIGLNIVPLMNGEIEQLQIPVKGYFIEDASASWVNRCDYNGMIPILQQFIFGKTYLFDRVKEIPGAPNSSLNLTTASPTRKPAATHAPTATPAPTTTAAPAETTTETMAPTETTVPAETTGPTTTATSAEPTATTAGTTATTQPEPTKHTKATDPAETTIAETTDTAAITEAPAAPSAESTQA